jgi:hypothetical protein
LKVSGRCSFLKRLPSLILEKSDRWNILLTIWQRIIRPRVPLIIKLPQIERMQISGEGGS